MLACMAFSLGAVPAKPGKIRYTQPDGTVIEIVKHGDEWMHWTTDTEGRLLRLDKDGYYRVSDETATQYRSRLRAKASERRSHSRRPSSSMTVGERHIPVILASFLDQDFQVGEPNTKFHNLLNQDGYSYNGATGSVRNFYEDNSHGKFLPVFDVYGPVTLPGEMATYGGNLTNGDDTAPELAVFEACQLLDGQIDFSQYDYDNDGEVDMILFYYAGYNEAEGADEDTIWPHQWEITYSNNATIKNGNNFDGKKLNKYFCTSELNGYEGSTLCGIGTTCHEFGHSLGLPDFYDTDYGDSGSTFGENHGCGADPYSYSTMCSGSYNNDGNTPPYFNLEERIILGWASEDAILPMPFGPVVIPSVDNEVAYKTPTSTEGEYFLYECRSLEGWDKYLPGGPGLVVYHIDKSTTHMVSVYVGKTSSAVSAYDLWYNWEQTNQINENAQHPCYYIVPAQDQDRIAQPCRTGQYAGYPLTYDETRIPFPGTESVTSFTAIDWDGAASEFALSNIAYASGQVTATVKKVVYSGVDFPFIANPGNGIYQAGEAFSLAVVTPDGNDPDSVAWKLDGTAVSGDSVVLPAGSHILEAEVVLADGQSYTVTLEVSAQ